MGFSVFSFMRTELIAAPPFGAYIGSPDKPGGLGI